MVQSEHCNAMNESMMGIENADDIQITLDSEQGQEVFFETAQELFILILLW